VKKGNIDDILKNETNENIKIALNWLKENKNLNVGEYEIKERDIFAIVQNYYTKEYNSNNWEIHRKYIDIQYIEDGFEEIGITNKDNITNEITPYSEFKDIQFFEGNGELYELKKNELMIIPTNDYHQPSIGCGNFVKKIVIKIKAI